MNYLQLVQRLHSEAGISGATPTTVVDQSGEYLSLVNWINDAWHSLQLEKSNWRFMRASFSGTIDGNASVYTGADFGDISVKNWDEESFLCYKASSDPRNALPLRYVKPQAFRHAYGLNTVAATPRHFTETDERGVEFGPLPDDSYVVSGKYYKRPSYMTIGDDETPGMPEDYHLLIVYDALYLYAMYESAAEARAKAIEEGTRIRNRLYIEQLPDPRF